MKRFIKIKTCADQPSIEAINFLKKHGNLENVLFVDKNNILEMVSDGVNLISFFLN
jgi:hypothetical protein